MPIIFEDEEEYAEGLDVFTEQMKVMGSEATTGTELSTSYVTLSERTRTLTIQRATSNRSLSPMDIDSGSERMHVEEPISPGPATTGMRVSPTSAMVPIFVPSKRPTDMPDVPGPSSLPSSPSTSPQPAKRHHSSASAPRRSPQANAPEFGTALDAFIIAHDASAQLLFDENGLAWGTIYEIARGVTKSKWKWSSVTREKVEQLRGTNAHAAHRVASVMQGREVPRVPAEEIWIEYDREQDAILENRGRGLGGMGSWKGKDCWFGGRIQQVGRLVLEHRRFSIQLEKPEIRRSHRFSRFLGSRRILQVRVSDDLLYKHGDQVREIMSSGKFVLCGRVFLPFHAKEGSAYMIETDQDHQRAAKLEDGDQFRISLRNFIDWHNPWLYNAEQPISKWSTRWALGLSTSIPTIIFEPQYILFEDDEYVSPKDWEGKAPAEKVFTDGCGFINGSALTQIMKIMGYSSRPTAVQGRIGGSKGMWVLHPSPFEQVLGGPAKIWIRPSQTKIKLGLISSLGVAQRTFDLLAPSRVIGPSHLSSQTLVNLSYNGINHSLLTELMSLGLKEEIHSFIEWTQPHSMVLVWKAVERAGSVIVTRLRRLFSGQARALGLGQIHPLDNQDQGIEEVEFQLEEEEGVLSNSQHSQPPADPGHKQFSGQPLSLHETVLELIQAGFHPLKSDYLFQRLEYVITLVLDEYLEKFHIPIMESCEAYIIPDPYGVLEEGQIHFKTSEPIVNPSTGEQTNIILGDVLVSRNPTRLPSDVQKVKAVAHDKLSNYYNVILFPIKGKQSLASFLGGGDYDGDTVMLNWCKPLVEQFKGSHLCLAPSNLSTFFEREVEHVRDFDRRASKLEAKLAQQALQKVLLLGLAETRVGLYSNFHDSAVYEFGYGHPKAILLAYMFTTCLDASKTGLRVKMPVFQRDQQQWGSKRAWYQWKLEQGKSGKGPNSKKPYTRNWGSPFILDFLVEEGEKLRKEALQQYRNLKTQQAFEEDPDLSKPWLAAKAKADLARSSGITGLSENLDDIHAHVQEAWAKHQRAVVISQGFSSEGSTSKGGHFEAAAAFFAKSPAFRGFVFFSDDDIRILKASLASTTSISFAFSVAFRDLCAIKARATGNAAPMTHQLAQCMTIPNVVVRTFSQVHQSET